MSSKKDERNKIPASVHRQAEALAGALLRTINRSPPADGDEEEEEVSYMRKPAATDEAKMQRTEETVKPRKD